MTTTTVGRSNSFEPGFQGTESSRCQVVFYEKNAEYAKTVSQRSPPEDPNLSEDRAINYEKLTLSAIASQDYSGSEQSRLPVIQGVVTENRFGTAGGTWAVTLKAAQYEVTDLRRVFIEGDWCDIVYERNGKQFHTVRGIVDAVQQSRQVTNSGVTSDVYVVTGRGFGKIFEDAVIYYDVYADTTSIQEITSAIFGVSFVDGEERFTGNRPDQLMERFLFQFLDRLGEDRRAVIRAPKLPGEPSRDFSLAENLLDTELYTNNPARISTLIPGTFNPGSQNLWALAQNYADAPMCELFCDLGPTDARSYFGEASRFDSVGLSDIESTIEPVPLGNARSRVYFRDRPFPTVARGAAAGTPEPIAQGPYYSKIPTHFIAEEQITNSTLTKSGIERVNTFAITGLLGQYQVGAEFGLRIPTYNFNSIEKHGVRRMDLSTGYTADFVESEGTILGLSLEQRDILRDFHGVNHLLSNGQIVLRPGRPDIRIGSRLVVLQRGDDSNVRGSSFYVEGVKHTYGAISGIVTTVTVTRGFSGYDSQYDDLIRRNVTRFTQPQSRLATKPDIVQTRTAPLNPAEPDPARPSDRTGAYILPGTQEYEDIWSAAVPLANAKLTQRGRSPVVTASWYRRPAIQGLMQRESGFRVGVVTGFIRAPATILRTIHSNIRAGRRKSRTASGFGQLVAANVAALYPSGLEGIGIPTEEAAGMLVYIAETYGSPEEALAFWKQIPKSRGAPRFRNKHWY